MQLAWPPFLKSDSCYRCCCCCVCTRPPPWARRHKYFPYYMAFYQPGKHQVPAAAWMQALLMYGKHRQAEVDAAQQPAALKAYAGFGQASKAALLLTLQQWCQAADAESRRQLGMPDAQQVEELRPGDS